VDPKGENPREERDVDPDEEEGQAEGEEGRRYGPTEEEGG
jgi:hypothetical protein